MEPIARLLANPSTVIGLVSILFLLAAAFCLKFRSVVRASKLALRRATALLETTPARADFAAKYLETVDRIGALFAGNKPLKQQWERFQAQLTRGEDGTIFSYRQPDEFFHSAILLRDRWLPLCKAGPGYLVGIGLVFTFLGIAVVIYRASLTLGSSNDLSALRDLLGAASLKFWTSLAGVGLSVITSGYFRHLSARFTVAAAEFSYVLSTRVLFLSQEYSLQMANHYQARQAQALEELRVALLQGEQESSDRIVQQLQSLQKGMVSATESTFSDLVAKSTSQLSAAMSNSLREVAGTFVEINSDLKVILAQVRPLPSEFKSLAEAVIRHTEDTGSRLQQAGVTLLTHLGQATSSSGEIAEAFGASAAHARGIQDSLDSFDQTAETIGESLGRLNRLEDVSHLLQEAAAATRGSSDALLANWQQQAEHTASLEAKLAQTVAVLPQVFNQYSEAMQRFSENFDSHLGRVLGAIATQVESLEAAQDSLRRIAENLYAASREENETPTADTL